MIRFRTTEDEKRYVTLVTEVYLRLGSVGIPPMTVSEILRNLAKIEAFAFNEGVRQGTIAGSLRLSKEPDPGAHDLHFALYGTSETPLSRCEEPHRVEGRLFDVQPVQFAPLTLKEAIQQYGSELEPSVPQRPTMKDPGVKIAEDFDVPMELVDAESMGGVDVERDLNEILKEIESSYREETPDDKQAPELIDRMRDELQRMLKGGWRPKDYPEIVLSLQTVLHMDAVFIDLQLGSEMGRTLLMQVGLFDLPLVPRTDGAELDVKFLESLSP